MKSLSAYWVRFFLIMLILPVAFVFTSCTGKITASSEGYGGDDQLEHALLVARGGVAQAVRYLKANYYVESLCDKPADTTAFSEFDVELSSLDLPESDSKKQLVVNFLMNPKVQDRLIFLAEQTDLQITGQALIVGGDEKDAMTELSDKGPVIFNAERANKLSSLKKVAVWTHELSHKFVHPSASTYLDDKTSFDPFQKGSEFLDSVGACLAVYYGQVLARQDPDSCRVDVKAFGAKGDSQNDDTQAIQNAVYAAANEATDDRRCTVFFPEGEYLVNPAVAPIYLASNLVLEGESQNSRIKVRNNAGNYAFMFSSEPFRIRSGKPVSQWYLRNLTIRFLTIDQNYAGNQFNAATGEEVNIGNPDPAKWASTTQYLLGCAYYDNLVIENNSFLISGVRTFSLNAFESHHLSIRNNTFEFHAGRSSSQNSYGNLALFINAKEILISRNHFVSKLGGGTAIDVAGGCESEACVDIRQNIIENYETGINLHSATRYSDPNFVAVASNNMVVESNTIYQTAIGISLWAATGEFLKSISIKGNQITIDPYSNNRRFGTGIYFSYWGNPASGTDGLLEDISVDNNWIKFLGSIGQQFSTSVTLSPNLISGISFTPGGSARNISVTNNVVLNSPAIGIAVGQARDFNSLTDDPDFSNIVVTGNTIVDAGHSLDSRLLPYRTYLKIMGKMTASFVTHNRVEDTGTPNCNGRYNSQLWLHPDAEINFTDNTTVVQPSCVLEDFSSTEGSH